MTTQDPLPLTREELLPYLARLDAGEEFKPVFEELLLELSVERSEHLSLIMREGRGAWLPLLHCDSGKALFVGNSFSATAHVAAALRFRPHLYDVSEERMRFEAHRCLALTGVTCSWSPSDNGKRLPFEDNSFDLVVQESGTPGIPAGFGHDSAELHRVCRGELVVTVNNRLGYKRSLGRRGRFAVPSPQRFLGEIISSKGGERTLRGYRKTLQFEDCLAPQAFALYPHSADFTHVVAIDKPTPRLHIGPKERKNKLKMAAKRLGLFRWLAPSFAMVSTKRSLAQVVESRMERVLTELSEISGERRGELDEWIATRGNCVVVQTRPASGDMQDPEGRWCLHIALSPHKAEQVALHDATIRSLWEEGQPVPVPEPIYSGQLQGISLSCERRLGGLTAPQLSGNESAVRRMLGDTVKHFAKLTRDVRVTIDNRVFRKHFDWRFDIVAKHAGRPETQAALERLRAETHERLLGESMPLSLQHADLRSKHVQVDHAGGVLGFLDWGSCRDLDVPYFDLLQLIIHETKQTQGGRIEEAWQQLMTPGISPQWERQALDAYAAEIGISKNFCGAMEACFPVFVAAMAESNWDYSRPRWVHRSFGI
jgi:hypothetical protein